MSRSRGGAPLATDRKSLLIEGWRTTNHSFALANQHQILELRKLPGLRLFHRDAPLYRDWHKTTANSGFSPSDRQSIDTVEHPDGQKIDCVYRIFFPFQASTKTDRRKAITYIVIEVGPSSVSFERSSQNPRAFTRDNNRVVTPSNWSRDRLVDWGFDPAGISVVPHGVDSTHFRPLTAMERHAARQALGLKEEEIVFLNVGASVWNKGVDLLLVAFAQLRSAGRPVRLILRDRMEMYGFSIVDGIQKLASRAPGMFTPGVIGAISILHDDVSRDDLRRLYASADYYVSPYRAEGFNLPALESIACGTPVIVTKGGATDDFCSDEVAIRISGTLGDHEDKAAGCRGRYIAPNFNDLVEAMDAVVTGRPASLTGFDAARERLIERFCWRNAAHQLASLAVG